MSLFDNSGLCQSEIPRADPADCVRSGETEQIIQLFAAGIAPAAALIIWPSGLG
jgi:hypothetical protein